MSSYFGKFWVVAALAASAAAMSAAPADAARISELYFDPPSDDVNGSGNSQEFIELSGAGSLNNYYLVFVEAESNAQQGKVEAYFNLSGMSFGANGYAVLLPKGSNASGAVSGSANTYQNFSGDGYGVGGFGSDIGFVAQSGSDGDIENSGFTALLIETSGSSTLPSIDLAIDTKLANGSAGSDLVPDTALGWTIHDQIGVIAESDDVSGAKLYSQVNFTVGNLAASQMPAGADEVITTTLLSGFDEIEYLARQGVETSVDEASWIAANLKLASGSTYEVSDSTGHAVLGGTAGSHWAQNFDVTNTYGTANHTPEPGSLMLAVLGGLATTLVARKR